MWPWGHAAVAYLCYSGLRRFRNERAPGETGALTVVFAAQIADAVDKPLAWTFAVLESGRSLGHSLLVIVPVVVLLRWWLDDEYAPAITALGVGWVSHPFADGLGSVLAGEFRGLAYFVWPFAEMPPPEIEQSFVAHLLALELDPLLVSELALVGIAAVVWRHDGYPGLRTFRSRVTDGIASLRW